MTQTELSRDTTKRQVAKIDRDGTSPICPDCGEYVGHSKSGGKPLPDTEAVAFGWSCESCNLTLPSNCHGPTAPGFVDRMTGIEIVFRNGETKYVPVSKHSVNNEDNYE